MKEMIELNVKDYRRFKRLIKVWNDEGDAKTMPRMAVYIEWVKKVIAFNEEE